MMLWWNVPGASSCSRRSSGALSCDSSMSCTRVVTPNSTPTVTNAPAASTPELMPLTPDASAIQPRSPTCRSLSMNHVASSTAKEMRAHREPAVR